MSIASIYGVYTCSHKGSQAFVKIFEPWNCAVLMQVMKQ